MIERMFIEQGMKKIRLENYFKKELGRAGFTGMKIHKTPLVTRIVLHVAKPGLAIGKKGKTIRGLTEELANRFGIENPQIEIQQIEKPELDAKAMVDRIVMLLSRGYSWRSVAFRSIEDIMNAGAQGVELGFKGKLAGKGGRKRKERIAKGYMKKAGGQSELVDFAKGDAYPKAGAIGVKLRIIKPDTIFPDKISISDIIAERKGAKEEKEEAEKGKGEEAEKEEAAGEEKEPEEEKKEAKEEKTGEKKEKPAEEKKETAKEEKSASKEEEKPVKKKTAKSEKKEKEPAKKEKEAKGKKEAKEEKAGGKEEKKAEKPEKAAEKKEEAKEEKNAEKKEERGEAKEKEEKEKGPGKEKEVKP